MRLIAKHVLTGVHRASVLGLFSNYNHCYFTLIGLVMNHLSNLSFYLFQSAVFESVAMRNLRQVSMLVVDDSQVMRSIVLAMLSRLAVPHIDQAASGEEAIRR